MAFDGEGETQLVMSIETSTLAAYRDRARNTNVNDVTLLATDYLNHFNEALMLAELVVDMPDMLDDLVNWSPVSYQDHFRESGIADRKLAIEAYEYSPKEYRDPFDGTITRLDREIQNLQTRLECIGSKEDDAVREAVANQCAVIRGLIEEAGAVINGHIDNLNVSTFSCGFVEDEETLDQDEINAMFG